VKIATFNVNSVHARLPVLLRWLAESEPDVACLQGTEGRAGEVPRRRAAAGGVPRDLAWAEGVECVGRTDMTRGVSVRLIVAVLVSSDVHDPCAAAGKGTVLALRIEGSSRSNLEG